MAIQSRRGEYENFDPAKMLPGEWACVTNGDPGASDGKSVYMCFEAGKVKRMATYDDMKDSINEATQEVQKEFLDGASEDLQQATQEAQSAANTATQAASSAQNAAQNAESAVTSANAAVDSANAAADRANEAADNVKNDFYGARSTFPETGKANKLYIDNTVNPAVSYIWNGSDYVPAGGVGSAKDLDYDNSTSGLTSTNVQGAIDENAEAIKSLNSNIQYNSKISVDNNVQTYTAPSKGMFFTTLYSNQDSSGTLYYINIFVNENVIGTFNSKTAKTYVPFAFPVSKGDIIRWEYTNTDYCKSTNNIFVPIF